MGARNPYSCRACLVEEVKLNNLFETGLAELFGYLSKTAVTKLDNLPQYVCYYCQAQMLNFKRFQEKCQQSYIYFKENLQKGSSVPLPLHRTKSLILEYLPKEKKNGSNIDVTNSFKIYSQKGDYVNNLSSTENNKSSKRNEYDILIDYNDEDDQKSCNDESIAFDNETTEINVKNELFDDDEDIIPLKHLKIEKGTYAEIKELEDVFNVKLTKRKHKKFGTKPKKNKCNKYNEKFEKDFEEFSKLYNVKVICLSKEEQIRKVQERKDSKEFKDSRFSCDVCYKGFMSETAHKRHIKSHDPSSGSFVCPVCHMRYPTQRNLNTHARQHKKIFACALCDQVNVDTTRAKLHSRWHKGVKFPCKLCDKEFNANTTYLSHMREVHKPVTCAQCGQKLLGTNALNKHASIHADTQSKCDRCLVVFQSTTALDRHRRDNECDGNQSLRLKPCILCGENFGCRSSLSEHMRHKHSGTGDTFTCELCNSVFTSDRSLGAHFAAAHYALKPRAKPAQRKEYLCEWCAKSFPTALRLKLHHQLHSDERPYKCNICTKLLKTKAGLEFHINTHTGHRPYKCRLCAETFKSHAHRHNHQIMKHTTRERRHKCSSCDKSFVTASDLRKHVRYVHLRHPRPHQVKMSRSKTNEVRLGD
ncbi:hypothetical protein O0L34_g15738 [Tuta absoluta]|nr:hypothetical protein O0L34_g15738 [Tuta absoluta]